MFVESLLCKTKVTTRVKSIVVDGEIFSDETDIDHNRTTLSTQLRSAQILRLNKYPDQMKSCEVRLSTHKALPPPNC